jgi:hypothetical protein
VISASADGTAYEEVAQGGWDGDATEDVADFDAPGTRFVRLEVVDGYGGFGSAAEIKLVATKS